MLDQPPPAFRFHLARAVGIFESQTALARAVGCSQQEISRLLTSGRSISAELAKAIDEATGGAVGRGDLRPDLWAVPAPPKRRRQMSDATHPGA